VKLAPLVSVVVLSCAPATAADTCLVKADVGGKPIEMRHCAMAVYDATGVTLLFSAAPIDDDERKAFEFNSYPKDTDANGKRRTMIHVEFCPGGGTSEASAGAVKEIYLSIEYAPAVALGRSWRFDVPADADLKVEKLSGTLTPGGRLTGRFIGARTSNEQKYTWDIDFDLAVPAKAAASGVGCGG
jgi:hypothetical protein